MEGKQELLHEFKCQLLLPFPKQARNYGTTCWEHSATTAHFIQCGSSCVATSRFLSVFCCVCAARVGTQHITMLFFKCFHFCECSACERSGTVIGAALGSHETRVVSVKLKLELSFSMKTYIPMAYIHCTCMDFLKPVLKNVLTTFNHN